MCVLFHKPHMDPPVVIACVFFPQTTHGSTSGHCMCVLSKNHIWINQIDCMCVLSTNHIWIHLSNCMFVLILKPQTSTRVIACVFFSTNHTWIHYNHCMCVLFHKQHMDPPVVIACVLFPQTTHGSTSS